MNKPPLFLGLILTLGILASVFLGLLGFVFQITKVEQEPRYTQTTTDTRDEQYYRDFDKLRPDTHRSFELELYACQRAKFLLNNEFSHEHWQDFFLGAGYKGEVLAKYDIPINVIQSWLNSPTHSEILIDHKFTRIGICTKQAGKFSVTVGFLRGPVDK